MGGCSYPGCRNSTQKGFRTFKFPANPIRRKKWIENSGLPCWNPTKTSAICDAHFERNQYELHRQDGKIKLKPNAVPTIFPHVMRTRSKRKGVMTDRNRASTKTPGGKKTNDQKLHSEQRNVPKKEMSQTPRRIPQHIVPSVLRSKKKDTLRDNFRMLNDNQDLPSGVKIFFRSPFESETIQKEDHGYARQPSLVVKNPNDIKGPTNDSVDFVEVCFTNERDDNSIHEFTEEDASDNHCDSPIMDDITKEQENQVEESKGKVVPLPCVNCVELEIQVHLLEKKMFCMNSAMRMMLNKEERETYRSLVHTMMSNFQSDGVS